MCASAARGARLGVIKFFAATQWKIISSLKVPASEFARKKIAFAHLIITISHILGGDRVMDGCRKIEFSLAQRARVFFF